MLPFADPNRGFPHRGSGFRSPLPSLALRHKEAIACRSIFSGVGPACMPWSTTSKGWRLEKVVGMPGSGGEVIAEGELGVARPQVAGHHGG